MHVRIYRKREAMSRVTRSKQTSLSEVYILKPEHSIPRGMLALSPCEHSGVSRGLERVARVRIAEQIGDWTRLRSVLRMRVTGQAEDGSAAAPHCRPRTRFLTIPTTVVYCCGGT